MKKIILTLALALSFGMVNAQDKKSSNEGFSKGDAFLSGTFNFGSEKTGDTKTSNFGIAPKVGFFVTENIAIGAELGVGTNKVDNGGNGTTTVSTVTKTNGFTGGVFGRYYFTPASKFSMFANLGLGFGSGKVTTDTKVGGVSVSTDSKEKTLDFGLGLGFNYFVAQNWAIETSWAGLTYNTNDNGGNGAPKTNTFGLAANLKSINFGVLYKF